MSQASRVWWAGVAAAVTGMLLASSVPAFAATDDSGVDPAVLIGQDCVDGKPLTQIILDNEASAESVTFVVESYAGETLVDAVEETVAAGASTTVEIVMLEGDVGLFVAVLDINDELLDVLLDDTSDGGSGYLTCPDGTSISVGRWSGSDRYETAATISSYTATTPGPSDRAPVVFVATGTGYPDALAGGPAAAVAGAPVLLVTKDGVPDATAAELARLTPTRIVTLGGLNAVSAEVEAEMGKYTLILDRWAGADRFETAATISTNAFAPGVPDVFIATAANFPDALSGAAAAGHLGVPILLVTATGVPAATAAELARLAPAQITVLGGTSAVPDAVATALKDFTDGSVRRLAGDDRYLTSAAISAAVFPDSTQAFVATGANFPDALAGGPAAGASGSPILLAKTACLPGAIADELTRLGAEDVRLLGGTSALSSSVSLLTRCAG